MPPRDLYTMDDGDGRRLERPEKVTFKFPDGEFVPGDGTRHVDLDIEKKFLQLSRIDTEQFKYFYEKYHDVIFEYIFWKTGDYELTGDLTGDVFLESLEKLNKFTWQRYSFGAWLFHIARRTVSKHYRRLAHPAEQVFETERLETNEPPTPHQETIRKLDMQLVRLCMRHVTPNRHDALVFHYWMDLTVREISLIMQTSESNVKKHLVRGRRQILRWLVDNGMEHGLSEVGQRMIRQVDARESGWHLVDELNGNM